MDLYLFVPPPPTSMVVVASQLLRAALLMGIFFCATAAADDIEIIVALDAASYSGGGDWIDSSGQRRNARWAEGQVTFDPKEQAFYFPGHTAGNHFMQVDEDIGPNAYPNLTIEGPSLHPLCRRAINATSFAGEIFFMQHCRSLPLLDALSF